MANEIQKREITSLEEMKTFLKELQKDASPSVVEIIYAQFKVIDYIQSPTLFDTVLDSLIYGLKKSLDYSTSEQEKQSLRERFSFMIQNCIFFLDAQVQYKIKQHREESYNLLKQAGEQLAESVFAIAKLFYGGNIEALSNLIVKNVFVQNNEEIKGFFKRLTGWFVNLFKVDRAKEDFYETLRRSIQKLHEHHEIIGNSLLIKGMIDRYADDIAYYEFESEISSKDREASNFEPIPFWWIIGVGLLSMAVRALWSIGSGNFGWLLTHLLWIIGITIAYILMIKVVYFVKYSIPIWFLKRKRSKLSKKLHEIANEFKE